MRSEITLNHHPIYFIGAGPGDIKYLTFEGSEALEECSLVYAVDPYPETFARVLSGKTLQDPFERVFDELIEEVQEAARSAPVGFLVPGDITVFSPFLPIVEHFSGRSRVIAGVGALNAAAALLNKTLDMPGVSHSVVLTSPKHIDKVGDTKELDQLARAAGTMVLYMNNRPLDQLAGELSGGFEPDTPVAIVSRVGMEGEKVYRCTLSTMAGTVGEDDIFGLVSGAPSLAIIIVGDVLEAKSDPAFWNKRKEKFWNKGKGRSQKTESSSQKKNSDR
jgi:precorrin-4/cobalt-precorrin-4 C11-methyltransferase